VGSARVCHGRDGVVLSMGLLGRCLFCRGFGVSMGL